MKPSLILKPYKSDYMHYFIARQLLIKLQSSMSYEAFKEYSLLSH